MDPTTGEKVGYGGSQKMQYHQGGAIPALAEEEMIAEDDEYDDLYNDVNVGEAFFRIQRSEPQMPSGGARHGGFHVPKSFVPSTAEAIASQEVNNARVARVGNYTDSGVQFLEQKSGVPVSGGLPPGVDTAQRGSVPETTHNSHARPLGFQGSVPMAHKTSADQSNNVSKMVGGPTPFSNPNVGSSKDGAQIPPNSMNSSTNYNINDHSMHDEYLIPPAVGNGNTMLFVGELHWWTTDAELESVLIRYGKVKEIKFFDERASGKSKGYCQVEFYDPSAAAACKERMNGHNFNGRACVVAFATSQTIKQMGASYTNKTQSQLQYLPQGRNPVNDGVGRGNGSSYPLGEAGRNFGRGGWGRGGNQMPSKGPGLGPMRGRGSLGPKNMIGNSPVAVGGAYGQGFSGPAFGGPPGLMHPQGMMCPSFDLAFMGRAAGYGGFPGPAFQGMLPSFPAVNSMGLPGVAPHINPAFFGRGVAPSGLGMMGSSGIDGSHSGMWSDANTVGWGAEEYGRVTGESSYGGDDNASEFGFGEATHDKGIRSGAAPREKERNSERDWSSNAEKRHREDRDEDGDRYDWDQRNREEKDHYRDIRLKDRDVGFDDSWDRGNSSGSRSRPHATPEENHRSQSGDVDYGKRRRMPSG